MEPSYHHTRMIAALEERNEKLLKENRELLRKVEAAAMFERAGTFYIRMQNLILSDENIRDAWNDFYTIMALAAPDIRELSRMTNERIYLDLLRDTLDNGLDRPDRTGTGVRGTFGRQSRFDLKSFPLLTTKKLDLKSISSELLWFIEGSGDERRLAELRFGKPRAELDAKRTIWTDNAQAPYWKPKATYEGDLGRVYGVQWRRWRTAVEYHSSAERAALAKQGATIIPTMMGSGVAFTETDQLAILIDGLRRDPFGRRHILSAWNPGEMSNMALPPCHVMAQFYVSQGLLTCMLTQRSNDLFLGSPYNIASYALLTHMIAQVCGYKVESLSTVRATFTFITTHFDAVKEQLGRTPKSAPHLYIDPTIKEIDQFTMDSFDIMGYEPHPAIKAKMAV